MGKLTGFMEFERLREAERERRAKIIHAEGEYTAAEKLAMAAEVIQKQPAALQLRYLQTLVEIGAEKNPTTIEEIHGVRKRG